MKFIYEYKTSGNERRSGEICAVSRQVVPTESDGIEALWEKRNNELRQMGVKLVPLPE